MHKLCTHKHKGTILCVDTYMHNKCPWKSVGAEEKCFDDIQEDEDKASISVENSVDSVFR